MFAGRGNMGPVGLILPPGQDLPKGPSAKCRRGTQSRFVFGLFPFCCRCGCCGCSGVVGVVGRSGTLGYEAASQMKDRGIGITTSVGIGGDPINGSSHRDILEHFENDPDTKAVMMIGEIGGPQEAEAAEYFKNHMTKPLVAYIAGLTAPKGRRMGHAGAIIGGADDTAEAKMKIMAECGLHVVNSPADIGETMAKAIN